MPKIIFWPNILSLKYCGKKQKNKLRKSEDLNPSTSLDPYSLPYRPLRPVSLGFGFGITHTKATLDVKFLAQNFRPCVNY